MFKVRKLREYAIRMRNKRVNKPTQLLLPLNAESKVKIIIMKQRCRGCGKTIDLSQLGLTVDDREELGKMICDDCFEREFVLSGEPEELLSVLNIPIVTPDG